jgi:hypothetical protein
MVRTGATTSKRALYQPVDERLPVGLPPGITMAYSNARSASDSLPGIPEAWTARGPAAPN